MKLLVIQHSAADRAAAIGPYLDQQQHEVKTVRIDQQDAIPTTVEADVLMTFGGAASLTSGTPPPWVEPEQDLLRRYVESGRRVLGICFGAQLLASALGAPVRRNDEPEVGWHQVRQVEGGSKVVEAMSTSMTVLQWHQDTFGIPAGASRIFESEVCQNQGFCLADRVFGLQFHLEADARTVQSFVAVSKKRELESRFVQTREEILAGIEIHLAAQTRELNRFLQRFLAPS